MGQSSIDIRWCKLSKNLLERDWAMCHLSLIQRRNWERSNRYINGIQTIILKKGSYPQAPHKLDILKLLATHHSFAVFAETERVDSRPLFYCCCCCCFFATRISVTESYVRSSENNSMFNLVKMVRNTIQLILNFNVRLLMKLISLLPSFDNKSEFK